MTYTKTRFCLVAAAAALVMTPDMAFASGGIGGVAETLDGQLSSIAKLIGAVAFVLGLGLGASGLMKFRQHSDNPNAVPISQPIVRLVVASMLIALPAVLGVTMGSLLGEDPDTVTLDNSIDAITPR